MKSLLLAFATLAVVSGTAIIDPALQQRFIGGNTENVMVSFTQGISSVFDTINSMNFSSIGEKRTALTNMQQAFTASSQLPLQTFLKPMGVKYESFWINNRMIIPNANSALVQSIARVSGVARIEKEPKVELSTPILGEDVFLSSNATRMARQNGNAAWGVKKIRADQVWSRFNGRGIVVAGIDTGVRYTHETLRARWRSNYGWYDPYRKTSTPNDQNGHRTHTMGTIAGSGGIGVAPGATWIACKGCSDRSCGGTELYKCGQFIQCPHRPDESEKNCNFAPDVVSNSWGSSGGISWYDDIINSWHTAEIIPVFSIGNSGPNCNTAGSPGDRAKNIAVGSMDSDDRISSFSSLGPSSDSRTSFKPDIAAPGGRIVSAWIDSDKSYATSSGTSMACPHVSGVAALMLQKNYVVYDRIYNAMMKSVETATVKTDNAKTCGGRDGTRFPNNVFGYGRVDAVNAVNAV